MPSSQRCSLAPMPPLLSMSKLSACRVLRLTAASSNKGLWPPSSKWNLMPPYTSGHSPTTSYFPSRSLPGARREKGLEYSLLPVCSAVYLKSLLFQVPYSVFISALSHLQTHSFLFLWSPSISSPTSGLGCEPTSSNPSLSRHLWHHGRNLLTCWLDGSSSLSMPVTSSSILLQFSASRALCWTPSSFKVDRAPGSQYLNPPYWSHVLMSHLPESLRSDFLLFMTSSPIFSHLSPSLMAFKQYF